MSNDRVDSFTCQRCLWFNEEMPPQTNDPSETSPEDLLPIDALDSVLPPDPTAPHDPENTPASHYIGMTPEKLGIKEDPKHNPFQNHIARPSEVPLQRTEDLIAAQAQQQVTAQQTTSTGAVDNELAFIMNPPKQKQSLLPSSLPVRIALGLIALLIVAFVGAFFSGAFKPQAGIAETTTVVQEQQQLLHLAKVGLTEPTLNGDNINFSTTLQLSLSSSQGKLASYLVSNKVKLTSIIVNGRVNGNLDTQLITAANASNYNPVYHDIMVNQLETYIQSIRYAYHHGAGPNARFLLNDDFHQAETLLNTYKDSTDN